MQNQFQFLLNHSIPHSENLLPTDNFSAQIRFDDGSCVHTVYTALVMPGLGKERMELFFDCKSIVMDDYVHCKDLGCQLHLMKKLLQWIKVMNLC